MKMAVAGPLMSLGIAAVAWLLSWSVGLFPFFGEADEIFRYLARMNFILGAFNLLPGFPLDGGRIFRSLLWWTTGDLLVSSRVACWVGQALGLGLVGLGCFQALSAPASGLVPGLWLVFIGWFLGTAARMSLEHVIASRIFAQVLVSDLMNPHFEAVPADATLLDAVNRFFLRRPRISFPVVEGKRLRGMLNLRRVQEFPRAKWGETSVLDVVETIADADWVPPEQNG